MATLSRLGRAAARAAAALRGCAGDATPAACVLARPPAAAAAAASSARGFAASGAAAAPSRRAVWASPLAQQQHRGFAAAAEAQAVPSPLMSGPPPPRAEGAASAGSRNAEAPRTAQAMLVGVRISPKRLNMVAQLTRGLSVDEAEAQLELISYKKAARIAVNVLRSAKANATNNHGLDASRLSIQRAYVGKGRYLKRVKYHARGKSGVMHHGHAHLTFILEERPAGAQLSRKTSRRAERPAPRERAADAEEGAAEVAEGAAAGAAKALEPSWMRHRRRRLVKRAWAAAAAPAPVRAPSSMPPPPPHLQRAA